MDEPLTGAEDVFHELQDVENMSPMEPREPVRKFAHSVATSRSAPKKVGMIYYVTQAFSGLLSGGFTTFFACIQLVFLLTLVILASFILARVSDTRSDVKTNMVQGSDTSKSLGENVENVGGSVNALKSDMDDMHVQMLTLLEKLDEMQDYKLPRVYSVGAEATTIAKDQKDRGSCWDFAAMAVLESDYRVNGIKNGWLDDTEFYQFSEQAFGRKFCEYCSSTPSDPYCGGKNDTEGGNAEHLYFLQSELKGGVVAYNVCAYMAEPEQTYVCPGYEDATDVSKNPIRFTIGSIDFTSSLTKMKRNLVKYQMPAAWTSILLQQTFLIPCSEGRPLFDEATTDCETCSVLCENAAGVKVCCFTYRLETITGGGEFYIRGQPSPSGGHAQLLVGYNDDLRMDRALLTATFDNYNQWINSVNGGIILKNSWGYERGHSLQFWAGEISENAEELICPCPLDPENWSAVNGVADLDLESPIPVSALQGAKILSCTESGQILGPWYGFDGDACSTEYWYAMASEKGLPGLPWMKNPEKDIFELYMVRFPKAGNSLVSQVNLAGTLTPFWSNKTVFNMLADMFVNEGSVVPDGEGFTLVPPGQNDPDLCGYFFMTYNWLQESARLYGLTWATWFDIEWDPSSYVANKGDFPNFDYTLLENSKKKAELPSFKTPWGQ